MLRFIIAYLLIYGGVHAVFFQKIKILLPGKWWALTLCVLFLLFMMLSPALSRMLEVKGYDPIARCLAFIGYFWMGFILYFIV